MFIEGVPATQLYGFILQPAFIDMGYELLRDQGKLPANMLSGDVLADPSAPEGQNLRLWTANRHCACGFALAFLGLG